MRISLSGLSLTGLLKRDTAAWLATGGAGQLTVLRMPPVAAPTIAGGVNKITVSAGDGPAGASEIILFPTGSLDLTAATIHAETGLPQAIAKAAGGYDLARVTWNSAPATVTAPAPKKLIINLGRTLPTGMKNFYKADDVKTAKALLFEDGTASGVSMTMTHNGTKGFGETFYNDDDTNGRLNGPATYDGTLYNQQVLKSSIYSGWKAAAGFTITGLPANKAVTFSFVGSRIGTGLSPKAVITNGTETIKISAYADPADAAKSIVFTSDGSGNITFPVTVEDSTNYIYLSGMMMEWTQ